MWHTFAAIFMAAIVGVAEVFDPGYAIVCTNLASSRTCAAALAGGARTVIDIVGKCGVEIDWW